MIPARKNSEELPNKNLRIFNKKPLIQWTLEEAKKSKYIDKVLVSSNSEKILKISKKYKNFIISKRPNRLCLSNSKIIDAILYEVKKFRTFDILILLQPTSPLRTHKHIDESLISMINNSKRSCVSFVNIKYNPHMFFKIKKQFKIEKVYKKNNFKPSNRQSYRNYYYPSGDIFISYISRLRKKKTFIDNKTLPYLIDSQYSSDIDTYFDFKAAEIQKRLKIFLKKYKL